MRAACFLIASCALLAAGAAAQARDGAWVSYRDAYRMMVVFEKYGGAKSLIQDELQVVPADSGTSLDGLQLTLSAKTVRLQLPLDATGRAVFPLHKSAYDENAALVLDPKGGAFTVRARVSVQLRPDGVYQADGLRAACEQALGYARYIRAPGQSGHCRGVRFVFARQGEQPVVRVRRADGAERTLAVVEGEAFEGEAGTGFPTVTYPFGGEQREQVTTYRAPLAIVPLFD